MNISVNMNVDKSRTLSLIAAALIVTLAGCKQEASNPQDGTATSAAAQAGTGISARDGKLVLPPIPGRPGAVYFTVRNDGSAPVALTSIEVTGAGSAQMHETSGGTMKAVDSLPIAPGAEIEFAPGGLHVMVFDISGGLKPGLTTDLVLTFSNGKKLTMPVMIDTMGGAADGNDMDGMGPMAMPSGDAGTGAGHGNHGDRDKGDAAMGSMPGMGH
ncbi:hypothetical protein EDF56_101741 [Novosphingobium sp. PhB165]|uniref:copper chaperone PCu(A)C n=1 Tax=Novosphingobium sp. PhB165 TaxID=2485105 RepID=UPI0010D95AB6|nr:copper chaperone PCu(A)C [Novosphingobium sp. PhB165]TCM22061.1 hypothetical protein EDF56_101741 [Novosphingobium sp. PhB165]